MRQEMHQQTSTIKILLVDDKVTNIDVLAGFLRPLYHLTVAMSGKEALAWCFERDEPDLILLDIMMPGMDGFEVCRQLKENKKTRDIPVIFVTAKNEKEDEVMGFEAGAVDFIVKPINECTLRARVATHLELHHLQKDLQRQVLERTQKLQTVNSRLHEEIKKHQETSNSLRDNEIIAMRTTHLTALGTIAAGMAHEINNPNSFIQLNIPILQDIFEGIISSCGANNQDIHVGSLSWGKAQEMVPQLLSGIEEGARRIDYIINHLRNFSMQDQEKVRVDTDLNLVIEDSIMLLINEVKKRSVNIQKNLGKIPTVLVNRYQIEQVIMNLLQNALDSLQEGHRTVFINSCIDKKLQNVLVEIKDNGCGMASDIMSRIFEPFFTTKLHQGGTGLGLSTSRQIIFDHGGSIDVKSTMGQGTAVTVSLPLEMMENR